MQSQFHKTRFVDHQVLTAADQSTTEDREQEETNSGRGEKNAGGIEGILRWLQAHAVSREIQGVDCGV